MNKMNNIKIILKMSFTLSLVYCFISHEITEIENIPLIRYVSDLASPVLIRFDIHYYFKILLWARNYFWSCLEFEHVPATYFHQNTVMRLIP